MFIDMKGVDVHRPLEDRFAKNTKRNASILFGVGEANIGDGLVYSSGWKMQKI